MTSDDNACPQIHPHTDDMTPSYANANPFSLAWPRTRTYAPARAREAKPMPCCTATSIRQGKPDASKTRQNRLQGVFTPNPYLAIRKFSYRHQRIFEGLPLEAWHDVCLGVLITTSMRVRVRMYAPARARTRQHAHTRPGHIGKNYQPDRKFQ
jgi:hypothetical protein